MKSEDILKKTQELLGAKSTEKEQMKQQLETERRQLISSIGENIAEVVRPALEDMIQASLITAESVRQMLKEIKVEAPKIPEIKMPTINVPQPRVTVQAPTVNVPPINIPQQNITFPERMSVSMDSVNNKSPLPVMMMDSAGKPMSFSMGSGGGGKADFITIKDIRTSSGASVIDQDTGALKITGDIQVTAQAGSTIALVNRDGEYYNGDNPLPITGSLSTTPGATFYASDAIGSVNLIQVGGNSVVVGTGYQDNAIRVVHATDAVASVNLVSSTSLTVTGITNTTAVANIDSSGVQYSGSNPFPMRIVTDATATVNVVNVDSAGAYRSTFPVSGTVAVSGVSGTSAVNISDSSGIGYSGSNPLPVTMVTSSVVSTIAVGAVASDVADDGSAPIKTGGIARQANPTAVAAGDNVSFTADDLGRQINRPVQVRDLIATAYATLTNGTETTLLAATAGSFHDLIYVMGANSSDVAVAVDIRPVTAGNVVMTLVVPASGTAGVSVPVPIPQSGSDTGNNWTADMGDITGTTVYLSALFSREV